MADIDMISNLGQPYNNSYCNLDPIYDFKPCNTDLLVMSRLAFSLKKNKIQNYMRKVATQNYERYQMYAQYKQDAFPKYH